MLTRHRRANGVRPGFVLGLSAAAGLATLVACSGDGRRPDKAGQDVRLEAAWTEIGEDNRTIARSIGTAGECPLLSVDGRSTRMSLRVAPGTAALRATASAAADSKPSAFPVRVCEARIAAGAKSARIGSHALPLPKADPRRIVIIGDTGCRMKRSGNVFQACNDADQWPFARIAAAAAAMQPDLVLHVGDYHYRENACPDDIAGCRGSPWGYGWDAWNADLFTPAAPLLAAAPWIVVRGNHEECSRAGQGWFRFLDPSAFDGARSCDDAGNDSGANYSSPYAIALGGGAQIVIFDSAKTTGKALAATDPAFVIYRQQFQKVATLAARPGVTTLFANHHPILGFVPIAGAAPAPGDQALQSVMRSLESTAYYPPGVTLALHGHVHDFQALDFSTGQPPTIVAGIAGDNLDVNLPDPFPSGATPAPGAAVDAITHASTYGFLVMDRTDSGWTFTARAVDGSVLTTCAFSASRLGCDKTGFVSPPDG
ncbi:MAG: metallophosphoesterase [Solimonas sp.]